MCIFRVKMHIFKLDFYIFSLKIEILSACDELFYIEFEVLCLFPLIYLVRDEFVHFSMIIYF